MNCSITCTSETYLLQIKYCDYPKLYLKTNGISGLQMHKLRLALHHPPIVIDMIHMSHFKSYESYDNPTVHQRFAHFLIENTKLFRVSHLLIFFFEKFKFVLMKVVLGLRADTHLLINGAHPIYTIFLRF